MAGSGTRATATDFNNIQASIATIMGVGSGTTGYGQPILSAQVSAGAVISSTQWNNLRTDLSKARVHQTNLPVVDGTASNGQTLQIITSSTAVSESIRNQYSTFVNSYVSPNTAVAAAAQLSSSTGISTSTRSTQWGATGALAISHTVTVTFAGYVSGSLTVSAADHMRCFFNAGGSLQVTASLAGGTSATPNTKDADWKAMLAGFGTYTLYNTSASISGSLNSPGTISSATGFASLTTGNPAVTVLTQASSYSKYLENRYTIQVAKPTTNTLTFLITFTDNDVGDQVGIGAGVDEFVTGTITSTVSAITATGANVSIPAPTASSTAL